MATITTAQVAAGETGPTIPLSVASKNFKVGFLVFGVGAETTVSVQVTMQSAEARNANTNTPIPITDWHTLAEFNAIAAGNDPITSLEGNIFFPVQAVRFVNNGAVPLNYYLIQGAAL